MTARPLPDLTRIFARIGLSVLWRPGGADRADAPRGGRTTATGSSEADYLRALSFCMLLPGPEAMQLATWIGWRLHGVPGGLIAGALFVLPGALVVLALS